MAEATQINEGIDTIAYSTDRNEWVRDSHRIIALDGGELTISSGAVTVTPGDNNGEGFWTIDTESDSSSDELDTISGGSNGDIVLLSSANIARKVFLTGNGNIRLGLTTLQLGINSPVALCFDGTNWNVISAQNKFVIQERILWGTALSVGYPLGGYTWRIPPIFSGWEVTSVSCGLEVAGTSRTEVSIYRGLPITENPFVFESGETQKSTTNMSTNTDPLQVGQFPAFVLQSGLNIFWYCLSAGTGAAGFYYNMVIERSFRAPYY